MKIVIKKIVKGVVFVFFILGFIPMFVEGLFALKTLPVFALGRLFGVGLFLWFVYYLLYQCKYKWLRRKQ